MRTTFLIPSILSFIIASASFSQTAEETDAEPGYWTNLLRDMGAKVEDEVISDLSSSFKCDKSDYCLTL